MLLYYASHYVSMCYGSTCRKYGNFSAHVANNAGYHKSSIQWTILSRPCMAPFVATHIDDVMILKIAVRIPFPYNHLVILKINI